MSLKMLNFKKFLKEQNLPGAHNDYAVGAPVSYGHNPDGSPVTQLIIPQISKNARIEHVDKNSKLHNTLITVLLADNTKLYFSWDEFRRIRGSEPEKGKMLDVVFQRHPGDKSINPSKIISATCY